MSEHLDLEAALSAPNCPECGCPGVRPIDITSGSQLLVRCRACQWYAYADLPALTKTVIYLDTSTVSHIRAAKSRGETESPWLKLYDKLRGAVGLNVVCCPLSSIVEEEAELSAASKEILDISRTLAAPSMRHQLEVQERQIFRALDRFLRGEAPTLETGPPWSDAFYEDVHKWLPMYSVSVNRGSLPEWIEARRATKKVMQGMVEEVYLDYATNGTSLEEMRAIERKGYGKGLLLKGMGVIRQRAGVEPVDAADPYAPYLPTTLDLILQKIRETKGCQLDEAIALATAFLLGDNYSATPHVDIAVKVHTAVAMLCRGERPRLPAAGDAYDINHIATYLPYTNVFVADSFFATICNQTNVGVTEMYSTEVISLGEKDILAFLDRLDRLVEAAPQAPLAKRITDAIHLGGFHEELARKMSEYLKRRGIDPDAPRR